MDTTELAKGYDIARYRQLVAEQNTKLIAELIYQRFYERYIKPFEDNPNRHGFSMMAVSCMMIEALQSFKEGENQSVGKVFERFFQTSAYFKEFEHTTFYSDIRCALLHQAETTGGWRIWRYGELIDASNKTINADLFLRALKMELESYRATLAIHTFDSILWVSALDKLNHICNNSYKN